VKAVLYMLMLGVALGMLPPAHADEVPYVTTPTGVVDAMLSIAGVGAKDYLFDLGSGDGRIVITAAKQYHARGVGIDYDGTLIAKSRESAAREGVSDRVEFLQQDIFASDFRDATVLTMYLLPEVNLDLRPRILFELSAPFHKYGCIRAPLHPLQLRCASSPYSTVCLSRAPCWRGASTLSVRHRIYEAEHLDPARSWARMARNRW